ncbi:MAG TPA: bifunctional nuclease domain-containing protein [Bacteroidales bacterium]|jgi:bifunctional DNase/RNase|nr:bifunctional nuclease domain-containing protein [Bacteroidales bacterium]
MNKVKLNVLGISYSQTQTGAYALVLAEENGRRRIPIIVGGFEAQAIAIQLEGLKPPRPLTHDLFLNFARTFNIDLLEITVYKLEEGVFYSKLTCDNGQRIIEIDARTSDAIALALRFKCPIYTTEDILKKAGIILDFEKESAMQPSGDQPSAPSRNIRVQDSSFTEELKNNNLQELKDLLNEAISEEDYEKASLIRDEINRRKKE